jgi:hypothetical protein
MAWSSVSIAASASTSIGYPKNRAAHHRRFESHDERNAYIFAFVDNYNRTRLKCLGYKAPAEALANLPGPNTFAGVTFAGRARLT